MTSESNKCLVRRLFKEVMMNGNLDAIEEIVHDDFIDYTQPPGWASDRSGLRFRIEYFRTAFPDIHVEVCEVVAERDIVVHQQIVSGTHQGEFLGIPPTGNQIKVMGFHLFRVRDGKLVEHRSVNDELVMLRQLGAIPAEPR